MRTVPMIATLVAAAWLATFAQARERDTVQDAVELERSNPVRNPLPAWAAARAALPTGDRIRSVAFSPSGLFVFHSPPGDASIFATYLQWQEGAFVAEAPELREGMDCPAPALDASQIEPALQELLRDDAWQTHRARLDALVLECFRETVFWMLMPVPAGGYQAGVPIATFDVPFRPDVSPNTSAEPLPDVEAN